MGCGIMCYFLNDLLYTCKLKRKTGELSHHCQNLLKRFHLGNAKIICQVWNFPSFFSLVPSDLRRSALKWNWIWCE